VAAGKVSPLKFAAHGSRHDAVVLSNPTTMIRRLLAIGLIALIASRRLDAQEPTTPADAKRILTGLAADSMEGRGTGTPGARRAATMIAAEMKRAGLQPLGDSGFFQRVPIAVDSVKLQRPNQPVVWRVRPTLRTSFAALDTVPESRKPGAVNVIGVIRGSDPVLKDEVVLIDAHYDHLGMHGPGVAGDSIFNGADDDASGVTAVIEVARQLAQGPRPRRTIVFAATIGEEAGLLGTRWYIDHPPIPLSQMVANLEIEMIDRPDSLAGGPGRAWLTGFERSTMGEMIAAEGIPIVADKRLDQQFFMRSDNIAFAMKGIPAHTLSTYNMHGDYHQVSDDASKADFDHMAAVINAAARAARLLADGPKPEWKPGGKPEPRQPRP
jgi:hypothetical protein